MNDTGILNKNDTNSIKFLAIELKFLAIEINKARAFNEIPNANSTLRVIEITEIMSRIFNKLD